MFDPCTAHQLLEQSFDDMDAAEVDARLALCGQMRSWQDAREARLLRRRKDLMAQSQDPNDPAKDEADRLEREQNISRGEAKRRAQTAEQLGHLPGTQEALENGEITGEHASAMASARAKAGEQARGALDEAEDELLEAAASESPSEFRKRVDQFIADHQATQEGLDDYDDKRSRCRTRFWNDREGMKHVSGVFDPDLGAEIEATVRRRAEERWRAECAGREDRPVPASQLTEWRMAQALGEVCRRADGADVRDGRHRPARVGVTMTLENLLGDDDAPAQRLDGTPVPAAVARRMACERGVIPIVLGGRSVPLDWGRARRFAQAQQVDALQLQYPTCTLFGCTIPADWCDVHHIVPFESDGLTNLDNLTFGCDHCHDLVHRPGWGVEKLADGVVRSWAPNGQEWFHHPRVRPEPGRQRSAEPQHAAAPDVETFRQPVLV